MTVKGVFSNAKEVRDLPPGEVVFAAGDGGEQMFGVVSGAIELSKDGRVVGRVEPGGTFGELAIIDKAPRSLTATAVEPSQIAVIDRHTFLFLVHETPMFAIQVMQALAARIRDLDGSGPTA
jgi:CRP-like cAMP-binding protein